MILSCLIVPFFFYLATAQDIQSPREAKPLRECAPETFNTTFEKCVFDLDGSGFQLFYTIHEKDGFLESLVRYPKKGWISLGYTPYPGRMVGGVAAIGGITDWGEPWVGDYLLVNKRINFITPTLGNWQNITNETVEYVDGWTQLYFWRLLLPPLRNVPDINVFGQTNVLVASGPVGKDRFSFKAHERDDRRAIKANFGTGTFVHQVNTYISLHAALMVGAWAVLIPLSLVIARHTKNECHPMWFYLHRALNTVAVASFSVGWAVAISIGSKTFKAHLALGTLACALGITQPFNAWFRPKKTHGDKVNPNRHRWELLHVWCGRVGLILALSNMILGWTMFDVSLVWTISTWGFLGAILVVYSGLEILGFQKIVPIVVQNQEINEHEPLVFRTEDSSQPESLRLDIVEDPTQAPASHKESLRRDILLTDNTTIRRWSYIH